jgi:beta-galactosidase
VTTTPSSAAAVDIVHPGGDPSGYDLVVAPQPYLVEDDAVQNLRGVVERGAVLLQGPFSGVADADAHVRLGRFPRPVRGPRRRIRRGVLPAA